ncbi:MAG TPA: glycosyltransferase [Planctomycetaceae bacterium]|jgi:UDP:flavonoid glycosyltransferase YjiC (YdhE family)|nr:glycosyltransferase [Planctomycetaceae bacterium]
MRLVVLMFGSFGDHAPSWEIAREAQHRGHTVTVLGNAKYLERLDAAPIETIAVTTKAESDENTRVLAEGSTAERGKQFRLTCKTMLRRSHAALKDLAVDLDVVLLSPHGPGGFAAHLVHEQFGTPVMEYFVDPLPALSSAAPWSERLERWVMNLFAYGMVRSDLNEYRRELGLPKVDRVPVWAGQHVDVGCGFFPEFVARARPFQPPRERFIMPGFIPLAETSPQLPPEVESFLQQGPPPVVVSRPSWGKAEGRFMEETCAALRQLGARGLFAGFTERMVLPDEFLAVPFLSFSLLLHRSRALLHHGGAGTVGAAMIAGVPQLVVPQIPMQADYGRRVQALGVGEMLPHGKYRRDNIAARLESLVSSSSVVARCQEYAEILQSPGPTGSALCCDELESLHACRRK